MSRSMPSTSRPTLLAVRKGTPKASLLLTGGGAALFVGLGLAALAGYC